MSTNKGKKLLKGKEGLKPDRRLALPLAADVAAHDQQVTQALQPYLMTMSLPSGGPLDSSATLLVDAGTEDMGGRNRAKLAHEGGSGVGRKSLVAGRGSIQKSNPVGNGMKTKISKQDSDVRDGAQPDFRKAVAGSARAERSQTTKATKFPQIEERKQAPLVKLSKSSHILR